MKKLCIFTISIIMIFGLLVWSAKTTSAEVISWRMQTDGPALDPVTVTAKAFAEDVLKSSNGRLKITVFAAGEIVPYGEQLQACAKNLIQMAKGSGISFASVVPASEITLGLPMMRPFAVYGIDQRKVMGDFRDFYYNTDFAKVLREAYAKHGVYWFDVGVGLPEVLLTKKSINKLDDFKGLKVKTWGSAQAAFIAGIGGSPYEGAPADNYQELMLGTTDGLYWDVSGITEYKYHEVAPYFVQGMTNNPGAGDFIININAWNSLPDDLKKIMNEAETRNVELKIQNAINTINGTKALIDEGKLKITYMDKDSLKQAQAVAVKTWNEASSRDECCAKLVAIIKKRMNIE